MATIVVQDSLEPGWHGVGESGTELKGDLFAPHLLDLVLELSQVLAVLCLELPLENAPQILDEVEVRRVARPLDDLNPVPPQPLPGLLTPCGRERCLGGGGWTGGHGGSG